MCGIAGYLGRQNEDTALLHRLGEAISHRGPDDSGIWLNTSREVGFTHRRLSIIDLSPLGAQPMNSSSGRFTMVFNGEIYNFPELKLELIQAGAVFKGASDTEVLLHGFELWGIQETIQRSVGMFAFAVWDEVRQEITLARDRMGEKPLYYGVVNQSLVFSSELKPFIHFPGFDLKENPIAISELLSFGYITPPLCIFQGISSLPPGHTFVIPLEKFLSSRTTDSAACSAYWGLSETKISRTTSFEDQKETVAHLLKASVKGQMIADVPIGAFLSGGVDSSLIVALMQQHSSIPIKTFSIGFIDKDYDEAQFAKKVAHYIGTDHHEVYFSEDDALKLIPSLPHRFDEPFADSSQLPTMLVSGFARSKVTVSLSGDGGDELFAGYTRYGRVLRLFQKLSLVPGPLRTAFTSILGFGTPFIRSSYPVLFRKLKRFEGIAGFLELNDFYERTQCLAPELQANHLTPSRLRGLSGSPQQSNLDHLISIDLRTYLPADILTKVDRAAMSYSLETRVPFLDHRIVEYACSLPDSSKLSGNETKRILRSILYELVPKALIERPKQGFSVPLRQWLRGPLSSWGDALVSEALSKHLTIVDGQLVQKCWHEFKRYNLWGEHFIWSLLMLIQWKLWVTDEIAKAKAKGSTSQTSIPLRLVNH